MTEVRADLVGSVLSVSVAQGQAVSAGDILLMLESMKMEIPVVAEHAGVVSDLRVRPGMVVQEGDVLLLLEGR